MKKEILNGRNLSKVLRLPSLIMIAALTVFSGCTDEDTTPSINEDFMNEMEAARMKMMENMHAVPMTMDPDVDFAEMMIHHHQSAIDMAKIELDYGVDENTRMEAQTIIEDQEAEIIELAQFRNGHGQPE